MPFHWSVVGNRQNAALATIAPVSASLLGAMWMDKDKSLPVFFSSLEPPSWAPRCKYFYAAMDVATIAPFGYASYVVWYKGGGFDYTDTKVALALYGATLLSGLLKYSAVVKTKKMERIACHVGVTALLALSTAIAFSYIDKRAAYLAIPKVLWTGFLAFMACHLSKQQKRQQALLAH